MKKKWVIIIFVLVLVLFILGYLYILSNQNNYHIGQETQYQPELMNLEEKKSFNLPEDSKIQVLKRGDNGQVDVYKIIRSEEDVENDPDSIEPIDPRY